MKKYLQIKKIFESHSCLEKAIPMAKYMRDQFSFYGIPTPLRRKLEAEFLKEEKKGKSIDWDFLDICFQDEHREFQYFVADYLKYMQQFLTFEDICKIKKYVKEKQWWDTIDFFDQIIGEIGLKDARVNDLMLKWSLDDDFWLRRIAIDHQLMRKEKTNTELLMQILVNNLGSTEFFINKAMGWALREYSKTNPSWVRNFIDVHRENMSKLSISEASKYI